MLKKQVKQTEKAQQRGISTDNLSLDATEKQGQNHGVFKYLLPPMGH
jgi:DNA-binding Xre family transcriptional regulator